MQAKKLTDVVDKDLLARGNEAQIRECLASFYKGENMYLHEIGGVYMGQSDLYNYDHQYERTKWDWERHSYLSFKGRKFASLQAKPNPMITLKNLPDTEQDLLKCQDTLVDCLGKWYGYIKVVKED